jgi:hypothetical protein
MGTGMNSPQRKQLAFGRRRGWRDPCDSPAHGDLSVSRLCQGTVCESLQPCIKPLSPRAERFHPYLGTRALGLCMAIAQMNRGVLREQPPWHWISEKEKRRAASLSAPALEFPLLNLEGPSETHARIPACPLRRHSAPPACKRPLHLPAVPGLSLKSDGKTQATRIAKSGTCSATLPIKSCSSVPAPISPSERPSPHETENHLHPRHVPEPQKLGPVELLF